MGDHGALMGMTTPIRARHLKSRTRRGYRIANGQVRTGA